MGPTRTNDAVRVLLLALPVAILQAVPATPAGAAGPGDVALAITNAVTATYDVDHPWQVFTAVDRNEAEVLVGGRATVAYAVGVIALAPTASDHQVTGTLGLDNPGPDAVRATLAVDLANAGACTVRATDESPEAGLQVSVAPGPSSYAYTCAPGAAPSGPASTTATAAWGESGATASATVRSAYAVDRSTGETTTVTDSFDGAAPVGVGTVTWADVRAAPDHRVLVTRSSRSLDAGDGQCRSWSDLVRESASGTTDAETVTVCVNSPPEVLGAQSFGAAVGGVTASCRGAIRAQLRNRTARTVIYRLRVGRALHRITVRSQDRTTFWTRGRAHARVTLEVGSTRLDRLRVPGACRAPDVLPDTGLRAGGG